MAMFCELGREKFLRMQLICLAVVGIQRNETVPSRAIFHVCSITILLMELASALFALEHADDIVLVCNCLGPMFTTFLNLVKHRCLNANRVELWKIIDALDRLKVYGGAIDVQSNKIDQLLPTAYLVLGMATGSSYIVVAVVKGLYIEWDFPVPLSFPFDTNHPAVFAAIFIWSSIAIILIVVCSVSSDATFGGLTSNVLLHFKLLQKRFQGATFVDDDANLKYLIKYHIIILDLSKKIMSLYRTIIITNLLEASLLLCILSFQLVMFLGSSDMITYLAFVSAIVIQVFFYSYYGSHLSHESQSVGDAIYCSNWYESSPKTRRILLQCLTRTQVPVNTKAGFMFASLPTLKSILSSAFSYLTMLLTFTDN